MVQMYALCVGYLELDRASMLSDLTPGMPWTVPVSSYLVVHTQGRLLFDTGVHCQTLTDPIGRMGEERARRIRIRSQVGDDVLSQLAWAGLQPDDITYVVNSHLHFDHCCCNEFFPHAAILVQKPERATARSPAGVASFSPSVIDFDPGGSMSDDTGLVSSVAGRQRLTEGSKRVIIGCIVCRCVIRPASPWQRSPHAGHVVLPGSAPGKAPLALRCREFLVQYHRRSDPARGHYWPRARSKGTRARCRDSQYRVQYLCLWHAWHWEIDCRAATAVHPPGTWYGATGFVLCVRLQTS